ncbi:MAG: ATP-binding cassette domain-containing protein, partial [Deltaproteobacteria bacterium]|nr:ATP-binding cassette domain-containing protein [Deltaproteobacteria bacterium]
LDEPTNHLDISSIQWLEEFLEKEYEGSLILVTHDVALQKRVTDGLAIVHGGHFYYRSHIRDYLTFRDSLTEEKRHLEKNIEGLQKKIDENVEFVEKYRAKARIASRAQSKQKMADKMLEELEELKDRLARVEGSAYNLHFFFRMENAGSRFPLSAQDFSFRYSETSPWIIHHLNLDVKRGQRIAIIGDNGAGKTTLLNAFARRLTPTTGTCPTGAGVEIGYFGQHQLDELLLEDTVLDNLRYRAPKTSAEQLRGWLGAFGFQGEHEISKKAKILSGGERARLALLRILVAPVNLCLLDEPTNHLDIETKALLKNAIRSFEGTVLVVSHDREFIGDIADRIIYLTLDHKHFDHVGDLKSFFEKYPQFVRHLEGRAQPSRLVAEKPEDVTSGSQSYEERKKQKNLLRSLERKISSLESDIEKLGQEKEQLQGQLDESFYSKPEVEQSAYFLRLSEVEKKLHDLMVEWEKQATALEDLKKRVSQ